MNSRVLARFEAASLARHELELISHTRSKGAISQANPHGASVQCGLAFVPPYQSEIRNRKSEIPLVPQGRSMA